MGCKVEREGAVKVIEYTQDFGNVLATIEKFHADLKQQNDELIENKFVKKMIALKSRRIGVLLVRLGTPLSQMSDDVHSPRIDHAEQIARNGSSLNQTLDS